MSNNSLRPASDYHYARLEEVADAAKAAVWDLTPAVVRYLAPEDGDVELDRATAEVLAWAAAQGHGIRWEGDDTPVSNGAALTILPILAAFFETHEGVLPSTVEYTEAWRGGLPGLPVSPARYAANHDRYKGLFYTLKLALGADGLDEAIVAAAREGNQP